MEVRGGTGKETYRQHRKSEREEQWREEEWQAATRSGLDGSASGRSERQKEAATRSGNKQQQANTCRIRVIHIHACAHLGYATPVYI